MSRFWTERTPDVVSGAEDIVASDLPIFVQGNSCKGWIGIFRQDDAFQVPQSAGLSTIVALYVSTFQVFTNRS